MTKFSKYRYALSLTSQFYFCGVPLRLDTTSKCALNCSYCFAMSRGGRRTSNRLIATPNSVARKLYRAFERNHESLDAIGEMLSHRVPIHFGGISDPFSDSEVSTISRQLLAHLSTCDYPVIISTKNTDQLSRDETMKILKSMSSLAIQISFTTADLAKANRIEPHVPSPIERIRCLETLSKEGIHTIARLQPLIVPWLKEVADELIPMLACAGCRHVAVEHLKLPVEINTSCFNEMFKAIKWNGYEFYKGRGGRLIGREWVLPHDFMWDNLQPLIASIRRFGMTYGSADYGLNHLGDTDCCCGIDNLAGFTNWFNGNFANVIRHANSTELKFDEVEENWFPRGSVKMFVNSNCRLDGSNNILSYLRNKWNRPGTSNAPDSFLGISWHGDYDGNGNCIYIKQGVS